MSEETYNGWKNYETWCVNLWLANDEGLYREVRELAEDAKAEPNESEVWTDEDATVFALADRIENFVGELRADYPAAGMFADLIGAALSVVAWDDIARSWLDD